MNSNEEVKTEIPYGYCHCGCGEKTNISKGSHEHRGYSKGQPLKFIHGHNTSKPKLLFCKNGHERTPENVFKSNGGCKQCQYERLKNLPEHKKEEAKQTRNEWRIKNKVERRQYNNERGKKLYHKNLEKSRFMANSRRLKNPESYKLSRLKSSKKATETISDNYVKQVICCNSSQNAGLKIDRRDIPPEVIELKRMMIQLTRAKRAYLKGERSNGYNENEQTGAA